MPRPRVAELPLLHQHLKQTSSDWIQATPETKVFMCWSLFGKPTGEATTATRQESCEARAASAPFTSTSDHFGNSAQSPYASECCARHGITHEQTDSIMQGTWGMKEAASSCRFGEKTRADGCFSVANLSASLQHMTNITTPNCDRRCPLCVGPARRSPGCG